MSRCPSVEVLEGFLEQRVSDSELTSLSRHIDRCGHCQAKLDELTGEVSLVSTSPVSEEMGRNYKAESTPAPQNAESAFLARLKENPPSKSGKSWTGAGGSFHPGKGKTDPTLVSGKFPEVSGYEIVGELGRGGMGVVYKARQVGLGRLVALKMILAGPHAGLKDRARFRQEAEAVACLHHPNIIQIHDIGESDGRPYLALEFVEGESLTHILVGAPQPFRPAARLIETLAEAMHYAHQRNIVHRDLKPANILLTVVSGEWPVASNEAENSSTQAPGHLALGAFFPKITDFGLAKRLDDHQEGTPSREVVGTPSYMAPEQAARTGTEGPTTDVYALGAIFYELLTGRPPFRGPTPLDTVLQVLHEDPVRPSYFRRDLPRDLETICLKCLAKEPSKRYASAQALADDLQRSRKGRPIKARPVGLAERIWKWARHRPVTAALVASLILVTLVGLVGITWQWQEARLARDDMEIQREKAEQARDDMEIQREKAEKARRNEAQERKKARVSLYFSRIAQSQLQWRINDFPSAKQSLAKCLPSTGQEDLRNWEWHYLQGLFHNDLLTLPHGHSGLGGGVVFSPMGDRIVSVVSGPPAGETPLPSEVRIWDGRTGDLIRNFAGPSTLHRLAVGPTGKRLALATTDGEVMIWDADSGKELLRRKLHQQAVSALAFSPDGKTVASTGWDRTVKIWDSTTGKVIHNLPGHVKRVQSVAFHPHKPLLASGSWDNTIKLWDLTTGKEKQTFQGHQMSVYCVAFSPDGRLLASAAGNGNLKIWDLETSRIVQSLTGNTGAVLSIAFSLDGRYLAKAGKDGTVRIWELTTGVERMAFRGHTTPVESVHFSPDCQRVVSLSPGDGQAKVWDLTRHPEFATFARSDADIEAVSFADKGQRLLSVTLSGELQTWDAATGMLLDQRSLPLHKGILSPAVPIAFSTDGKLLAGRTENEPHVVKSWNTSTGAEVSTFRGHALPVYCVRFSVDGRRLVTCAVAPDPDPEKTFSHEIKVWDSVSGNLLASFTGKGRIFNVVFSPDGDLLAWGGQEGVVTMLKWEGSQKPCQVWAHQGDVTGLAFSPDGTILASAGMEDRGIKTWKVDKVLSGGVKSLRTLVAPSLICDLTFSPDGRRLAAISRDMVKMWDVATGQESITLHGAPQRHWDPNFNPRLAFSPDGTQLAGTNWDESISVWEAPQLDGEEQFTKVQEKRRHFANQRSSFWHLQEAEFCLVHKNLSAARFHLKFMKDDALSQPLQARRQRLEAALSISKDEK